MISIGQSLKKYTDDADKAVSPQETVSMAEEAFSSHGRNILSELKRIDTGRLDIPVYLSICGEKAKASMPTRKQMGKGSSPVQAQASALMELAERYSYFSFVNNPDNFQSMPWNQAGKILQDKVIAVEEIAKSVNEDISPEKASRVLSLIPWQFTRATRILDQQEVLIPFNWFKKLNEFNGCSAGNTFEESILQGGCELVERHCCALINDKSENIATIDQNSTGNPVLRELLLKFHSNGIKVWLKDFSMNMPVPTVAAIAYDPATFPGLSEIVYTAGTATSPDMAAIRALTEIAQLAGDFHSASNYEASGLPKFTDLNQIQSLIRGPAVTLNTLPDLSQPDMGRELMALCAGLNSLGYSLYSVSTQQKDINIPANYNFIPGFMFRERTPNASLGLITGRILAEETDPALALTGLKELSSLYPDAFYIPFYEGMTRMRMGEHDSALKLFDLALDRQPDDESRALCLFYSAYTISLEEKWQEALPFLDRAIKHDPLVKEYFNLRGVAFYKKEQYDCAIGDFLKALDLDSGSATDLANLGMCYLKSGRNKAAHDTLTRALELDPTLNYARKGLEKITL